MQAFVQEGSLGGVGVAIGRDADRSQVPNEGFSVKREEQGRVPNGLLFQESEQMVGGRPITGDGLHG